ncbi:MAG: CHAT domain-containing tetratricopeptide repeat protein [Acidimicrobiia bacterium]|nr:CHAT domain-containing tetratricopeptide repeat protein [Acidimicrobiia bacterium]
MTPLELLVLAGSNPRAALTSVGDAEAVSEAGERAIILQAQGVAHWHLRNMEESISLLAAAEEAVDPDDHDRLWLIRADLAGAYSDVGEPQRGLDLLDGLESDPVASTGALSSAALGRVVHIQGLLYQRMGRAPEAVDRYRRAIPLYESAGDVMGLGHVSTNLAILETHDGNIDEALALTDRAQQAYESVDQEWWVAATVANRGWITGCGGDLPQALRLLSEADRLLIDLDGPDGVRHVIRAEVLLRAGLFAEAGRCLRDAVDFFQQRGQSTDQSEALILAAQAAELEGGHRSAAALAREASASLDAQVRPGWAAAARAVLFGIRIRAGEQPVDLAAQAEDLIAQLTDAGRHAQIATVLINTAWAFVEDGNPREARHTLDRVKRDSLLSDDIALLTLTEAALLEAEGRPTEALETLDRGFRRLESDLAILGGIDVAALAATSVASIAATAKRMLAGGTDDELFLRWADRGRQIATWRWPRLEDPAMARLLNRARALVSESGGVLDDLQAAALAGIRDQIQDLRWQQAQRQDRVDDDGLMLEAPDGSTLVDLTGADGAWYITFPATPSSGEVRAHPTVVSRRAGFDGPTVAAAARLGRLFQTSPPTIQQALLGQMAEALRPLDETLAAHLPDDPELAVLISVDEELADIPWAALPSLFARPFSVVFTHRHLTGRSRRVSTAPGAAVAVGPGLLSAGAEIEAVDGGSMALHRIPTDNFERFSEGLDRRVVHIAAHGGPEPDNPLFNWLDFGFGRVFLHDLMFLDAVPETVVLAACYAGQTQRIGAGGSASFANGFLGVGSRWVVAASTALADDRNLIDFASSVLHDVVDGISPPVALARARLAAPGGATNPAALAFTCYGG